MNTLRRRRSSPPPSPRPASPQPTEPRSERIHKLLAAAGHGSRRQVEAWIAAGRVTLRGRPARLGDRAQPGDVITLDGKPLALRSEVATPRVIAYHKPEGELVTRSDPGGRRTVFERLPALRGARWVAVGRLDLNSSGLLLLTDSGELANRLMHPRTAIEREYAARVSGELGPAARAQLLEGLTLEDGEARFECLDPIGKSTGVNRWYRVMLREGRNREVRRMFEAVGLQVSRLLRTRVGPVRLPRTLRPGRWVELAPAEVLRLASAGGARNIVRTGKDC